MKIPVTEELLGENSLVTFNENFLSDNFDLHRVNWTGCHHQIPVANGRVHSYIFNKYREGSPLCSTVVGICGNVR